MAGQVHDFERTVAEVDNVAVVEHARRRATRYRVCARVVVGRRQCVEQLLRQFVPGVEEHLERGRRELASAERAPDRAGRLEVGNARAVRQTIAEFVQRTGVIEVVVGRERERGVFEQIAGRVMQARNAESRVDEERAVAAAHEPDVAARERIGERLPEPPDHITDPFAREPVPVCNLHRVPFVFIRCGGFPYRSATPHGG